MKILIKNGHVIDPENNLNTTLDILVKDGIIKKVASGITGEADKIIDASGKYVCPGLIDIHVHLRDPGLEYKEDIITGTKAALKGGFTTVACMPNTNPVVDNQAIVQYIINKSKNEGYVNVLPVGSITKGLKGGELSEIGELKHSGAVAVSDDGRPVENAELMLRALTYAKMFDMPVISHSEELSLVGNGSMNEGEMSTLLGIRPIPPVAEAIAVSRDVLLAESVGAPLHVAHVSTRGAVEAIRQAKKRGAKVTCETAPHYFSLTDRAVEGYNTNAKMNPPLRGEDDVRAIIEGLKDGTIDVIATDHAPHHIDEKNVEFELAMNGIIGLETSLAIGITYLVKTEKLSLFELIKKMTVEPAKVIKQNIGSLTEGDAADITIFDPHKEWTVDVSKFSSKSKNSPYDGFKLYGTVENVLVGGEIKL